MGPFLSVFFFSFRKAPPPSQCVCGSTLSVPVDRPNTALSQQQTTCPVGLPSNHRGKTTLRPRGSRTAEGKPPRSPTPLERVLCHHIGTILSSLRGPDHQAPRSHDRGWITTPRRLTTVAFAPHDIQLDATDCMSNRSKRDATSVQPCDSLSQVRSMPGPSTSVKSSAA